MIDKGRTADLEELLSQVRNPNLSSGERLSLNRSIEKLANESLEIRHMREALIRATRSSDINEIKNIHEYVKRSQKNKKYGWT